MTNIATFEDFDSVEQIAAHQAGLVRVILEGDTDVELFERYWFIGRRDVFDFVEAKTLGAGAGCTAVATAVASSIADGVPAIGIVDRDTLFRNKQWALLFDTNSTALNQGWNGSGVYTASLWEVEAYLIEPDLLSDWVGASYKTPPAPQDKCDAALQRTIDSCKFMLSATHYFAALHEEGTAAPSVKAFWDQSIDKLNAVCAAGIGGTGAAGHATAAAVSAHIASVLADLPGAEADQLRFLLRYVDTKRLLSRLGHSLAVQPDSHWTLATFMKREGRRPLELDAILNDAEAALAA
ncbi:hypothetical protein GJ697_09855 [Pseudoduganella sp. FT25W]|uniref:DUF4435 domain-containing protein n=1 Tax=Duganella alba TaxID=2666081 RepID=A0A6L5QEK0_9BURK|nr:hypothetical protein [Duganella alba]MRX08136.1 hypothetical protein [Duganella alba]MRX16327.1 hypothetical protein [Duganella alba]